MKAFNSLFVLATIALTTACSGVQTQMPDVDSASKAQALAEIQSSHGFGEKTISASEGQETFDRVKAKIFPVARDICEAMEQNELCSWDITLDVENHEMNAYARGEREIVIWMGILNNASSDDELAMVMSHEIGHHIAEHIKEDERKAKIGAAIGGIASGALVIAAASSGGYCDAHCQSDRNDLVTNSINLGYVAGAKTFSVRQEREADMISSFILYRAGYDHFKARNFIVGMAKVDGRTRTGLTASHPAGPERLANFDKAFQMAFIDDDGIPNSK